MATQIPAAPANNSAPRAPVTPAEKYVQEQLASTSRQVRNHDIAAALLGSFVWGLAFLLLAILIDGWLLPLSAGWRWAFLGLVAGGSAAWAGWRLYPALFQRINPKYTAKMIESTREQFHNSLVNYTYVSERGDTVSRQVLQAVSNKAAHVLQDVASPERVDRSQLIRWGFALVFLFAALVSYTLLSPKSPWPTIQRVLLPSAEIARPARVSIENVSPGDARIFFGEKLLVTATVRGPHAPESVRLIYSTQDQRQTNVAVPLRATGDGTGHYQAELMTTPSGIDSSLDYWIEAGDGRTSVYTVSVNPNPTISVREVTFEPPAYTRLAPRTVSSVSDLASVEGARVKLRAAANLPIKLAYIEMLRQTSVASGSPTYRVVNSVEMTHQDREAEAEFVLTMDRATQEPTFTHFQIKFLSVDGHRNDDNLNVHPLRIIPDLGPEVTLVRPKEKVWRVPVNQWANAEVRGHDLDYELSELKFVIEHQGTRLIQHRFPVTSTAEHPFTIGKYQFRPEDMRLKVGDEAIVYAEAADNRHAPYTHVPEPNVAKTDNYRLIIVEAVDNPNQPSDSLNNQQSNGNEGNNAGDKGAGQNPTGAQPPVGDKNSNPQEKNSESSADGNEDQADKSGNQNPGDQDSGKKESAKDQSSAAEKSSSSGDQESGESGGGAGDSTAGSSGSQSNSGAGGNSGSGEKNSQTAGQSGANSQGSPTNNSAAANPPNKTGTDSSGSNSGASGNPANSAGSAASETTKSDGSPPNQPPSAAGSSSSGDSSSSSAANPVPPTAANSAGAPPREDKSGESGAEENAGNSGGSDSGNGDSRGSQSSASSQGTRDSQLRDGEQESLSDDATDAEIMQELRKLSEEKNKSRGADEPSQSPQSSAGNEGASSANPDNPPPTGNDPAGGNADAQSQPQTGDPQSKSPVGGEGNSGSSDKGNSKSGDSSAGADGVPPSETDSGNSAAKSPQNQSQSGSSESANDTSPRGAPGESSAAKSGADNKSAAAEGSEQTSSDEAARGSEGNAGQKESSDQNSSAQNASAGKQDAPQSPDSGKSGAAANPPSGGSESQGSENAAAGEAGSAGDSAGSSAGSSSDSTAPAAAGSAAGADANSPSTGSAGGGQGGSKSGGRSGGGTPADSSRNASGATPEDLAEAEELKYAKEVTDLVMKYLKDQAADPDDELLQRMNWTENDLRDFLKRWEEMAKAAETGTPQAQKRFNNALKGLGLVPQNGQRNIRGSDKRQENISEGTAVNRPPAELAEEYQSFLRSLNRVRSDRRSPDQ